MKKYFNLAATPFVLSVAACSIYLDAAPNKGIRFFIAAGLTALACSGGLYLYEKCSKTMQNKKSNFSKNALK